MSAKKMSSSGAICRRYGYELPDDALRLIFSRMCFVDQIRLSLVCKRWKTLLEGEDITPTDRLPWIMFYGWRTELADRKELVKSVCKLYVPSEKKTYTVEDGLKGQEDRGKFVEAEALEYKNGWVLFQQNSLI
ncbi:hypothetical protein Tsubulata_049533 [Turnera subulata]|uniref:F-box domain-containing protein n=1 Tax=Turnera subulata TaxID=218843 RepID=A0A9Q0JSY3_9ROSI|nr:hypothetical protein Tsubulata_049533 [Turnera subulata]